MDVAGNSTITNHDRLAFSISIIFLILTAAMLIILVFYFLYWRPSIPATSCTSNLNCSVGQICQLGSCVEQTCSTDSNCNNNEICINSYCHALTCLIGNDCPTGTACISGSCVAVGSPCSSNSDCFELTCKNGFCVQCNQSSDCETGQGCFNSSVCRYPYDGETGAAMITYISPAQNAGNITAPPAYFCPTSSCGTGPNNINPITCTGGTGNNDCPTNCPFCVNGVCRCTSGEIYETCSRNNDCTSGLCHRGDKICIPSGGQCAYNFNNNEEPCELCCTVGFPYCVNGVCSKISMGAMCGSTGLPEDMCSTPQSLGGVGPTGITPNGMGFFCVNGTCQQNPGTLNQQCTTNSCQFISDGVLNCVPVQTPSIPQMRCLRS